jgi:surfeit locus 1 family protein
MIKRLPIIPTLLVASACAVMIYLGVWQLDRAQWKAGLIESYAAAPTLPQMTFPIISTEPEQHLFRKAGAMCLEPGEEQVMFAGKKGNALAYRHIVRCRTGAEGPGLWVDVGWSSDEKAKSTWTGGAISGVISKLPNDATLISTLLGTAPPTELMLIATTPAPGFQASSVPNINDIPNSHIAYAGQWFFFALAAAVIYGLALRQRFKPDAPD